MTSNLLYLNSAKTEFLLLGLEPQLKIHKYHNLALVLSDGHSVSPTASDRNLGFTFDCYLTFSDQVSV